MRTRAKSTSLASSLPSRLRLAVWHIQWFSLAYTIFSFTNVTAILGAEGRALSPADAAGTLAGGTKIYIRLAAAVSTKTSHLHEAVAARVVREVTSGGGVIVPIGAEVTGTLEKVIPASDPADHARLLFQFNQLVIVGHPALNLNAHVAEVENARETVLQDGTIQGVLAKDAIVGRVDGMLDKLGSAGSEMEKLGGKTVGQADTSISYPAGTDLALALDQPLTVDFISPAAAATQISQASVDAIQKLLVDAPQRAQSKSKKPGDPLNLVVVGSSKQILGAFKQAGWSEAENLNRKSATGTVRAMATDQGFEQAPVSKLYLYDRAEDLAFEKMLNTFMKRHHLRLWQTAVTTADGREIWLGSSTHDIGLDVHIGVVSHATDPDLDDERAKVGADLLAGGLVAAEQLVSRPNPLSEGKTATGGTWKTDGQLLVIELKASSAL